MGETRRDPAIPASDCNGVFLARCLKYLPSHGTCAVVGRCSFLSFVYLTVRRLQGQCRCGNETSRGKLLVVLIGWNCLCMTSGLVSYQISGWKSTSLHRVWNLQSLTKRSEVQPREQSCGTNGPFLLPGRDEQVICIMNLPECITQRRIGS